MTWSPLDHGIDSTRSIPGHPSLDCPVVDADGLPDITDLIPAPKQPEGVESHATMAVALFLVATIQFVSRFLPVDRQCSSWHDIMFLGSTSLPWQALPGNS